MTNSLSIFHILYYAYMKHFIKRNYIMFGMCFVVSQLMSITGLVSKVHLSYSQHYWHMLNHYPCQDKSLSNVNERSDVNHSRRNISSTVTYSVFHNKLLNICIGMTEINGLSFRTWSLTELVSVMTSLQRSGIAMPQHACHSGTLHSS